MLRVAYMICGSAGSFLAFSTYANLFKCECVHACVWRTVSRILPEELHFVIRMTFPDVIAYAAGVHNGCGHAIRCLVCDGVATSSNLNREYLW